MTTLAPTTSAPTTSAPTTVAPTTISPTTTLAPAITSDTIFVNNTVYTSAGTHFLGDADVLMLNNIAASLDTGFSPITNCFNNIDRSGSLAATRGNIPNLALTFSDTGSDDYRLDQNDIWALGGGLQDNIQSYYYKDINNEIIEQWPIGAHATNPETRSIYFQAGSISDYMSGTPTISIVDGVATFSEAQTDPNVMIGSMISFTDMAEAVYSQNFYNCMDSKNKTRVCS